MGVEVFTKRIIGTYIAIFDKPLGDRTKLFAGYNMAECNCFRSSGFAGGAAAIGDKIFLLIHKSPALCSHYSEAVLFKVMSSKHIRLQ